MHILLSEKEDNVPKWTLELNSTQAAAESRHLIGHMLKVKWSKERYLYLGRPYQTSGEALRPFNVPTSQSTHWAQVKVQQ
jgi:hypothetical protein